MKSKRAEQLKADAIRRAHRTARAETREERARRARLGPLESKRNTAKDSPSRNSRVDTTLKVPPEFCFLTNPTEALEFIEKLTIDMKRPEVAKLTVDFSDCKILGLCAYLVLITVILDSNEERWTSPVSIFAISSKSASVNNMLDAPESPLRPKPAKLIRSPLIRGKSINKQFSKERDKAGTEIVDYLTRCLGTEGKELTPDGRKYIGNLITEAIGNAEEHSGPWVAAGYFVQQYETDPGECHLVLFNTGPTICDRIESPDASEVIRKRAEDLADLHLRSGFFTARLLNKWNKEALVTLYALQEGVSSRLHERASRGNGTVQMIKAFSELAGTDQKMCILSGSAYILFDGNYSLSQQRMSNTESREVISFNEEKTLEVPPDDKYVFALPRRFGGTVVSLRFRLRRGIQNELIKKRSDI